MAFLEIIYLTGDTERRELSKTSPLSIGSHRSNDIRVDEEDVELMHCRISWNKNAFEAVAAGVEPLDVNGAQAQRAKLKVGDVLRFGSVDVRFRESDEDGADSGGGDESLGELGLKPISEEIPAWDVPADEIPASTRPNKPSKPAKPAKPGSARPADARPADARPADKRREQQPAGKKAESPASKPSRPAAPPKPRRDADPPDFGAALQALAQESLSGVEIPNEAFQEPKPKRDKPKQGKSEPKEDGEPAPAPAPAPGQAADRPPLSDRKTSDEGDDEGYTRRLRKAMRGQTRRPGEEDPFRSPLVLGLTSAAVALVLAGLIFFVIAGRQTTQARFDAAKAYYDEGNFLAAIPALDEFLLIYPKHALSAEAKRLLGFSRIRQQIEGAAPNFPKGLQELEGFIAEQRDLEGFDEIHPDLAEMAKKLSLGAAAGAGKVYDPSLLEIARQARIHLRTYSPQDSQPTETLNQIERTIRQSEAAILEDTVYKEHIAAIEKALADKQPLQALKTRRDLITRYAPFERDRKVHTLTQQTLELERSLAKADATDRPPVSEEGSEEGPKGPAPTRSLSLVFQGRTRTDEVSVGQSVIAVAKNCIYGLDFVTGTPLWRREIGIRSPFFPVVHETSGSVYAFDTNELEMVRLDLGTGSTVWRQRLGGRVIGKPLLADGVLYASTEGGKLYSLDAETGTLTNELTFSQPVTAPVALNDGERLLVAGHEEVVYTLQKRPLQCTAVAYIGQQPGSIQAPLLAMGSYVLLIENKGTGALLRLLETETGDNPVAEVASGQMIGRVVDEPVIRGRDLYVPSTSERVTAFTVSNDPGQPPLTPGPAFQGKSTEPGPIHLLTGPDQVWMATGSLHRLRLTTDALSQEGDPAAQGISSQPLQFVSGYLLNARKREYTEAVTFTRTSPEQLTSDWQAVLGARILAWTAAPNDPTTIACVNEAGQTFRVGTRQWESGPFLTDAIYRLPLHEDLKEPLLGSRLANGRMAVACGGPEPRAWLINAAGQIEGSPQLPAPPEARPLEIGKFVVVPCTGRLHSLRFTGQAPIQDFMLPSGQEHHWLSVQSVGEDRAVAVTGEGLVYLIRLQTSPRPHLGEAGKQDLQQPVFVSPGVGDGLLAIADASQRLTLFDGERLEQRGQRQFEDDITNNVWIAGAKVFVQVGTSALHCLEPQADLPTRWTFDLESVPVAGITAVGRKVMIARQDGRLSAHDLDTGDLLSEVDVKSAVGTGPEMLGQELFVGTIDGTLVSVQSLIDGK